MKRCKKLFTLLLALALCLGLAAPAFAAEDGPERGVLTYAEHIAPQYEDAGRFHEGLAPVKQNGKWGYINEAGEVVIDFQYDRAYTFNEGYAVVGTITGPGQEEWEDQDATYIQVGFVDKNGGYTPFVEERGEWDESIQADVKKDFPFKMDLSYIEADESFSPIFHNGFALLRTTTEETNYIFGMFDSTGHYKRMSTEYHNVDMEFLVTTPANEGLVTAALPQSYDVALFDYDGNLVKLLKCSDDTTYEYFPSFIGRVESFNQGLAPALQFTKTNDDPYNPTFDYTWGFIDRSFNWVIQPQYKNYTYSGVYTMCEVFGVTGLACVKNADGKWGAIDKQGNTVVPFLYDSLLSPYSGLMRFKQDGKYGYLDARTYQVAIPAQYEDATGFSDELGLAVAYDGQKAFLIDAKGDPVPGGDQLDPSSYFVTRKDGSFVVYEPETYVVIQRDGKYGYGKIEYLPNLPEKSEMSGWAYEEVSTAIEEDLVPVYLQNLYRNNITRAEFCDLVMQALTTALDQDAAEIVLERTGSDLTALVQAYPFKDTSNPNVVAANALGIVNGRGNQTFDPYASISRQEAAAMLARTARILGLSAGDGTSFADADKISGWAREDVSFVASLTDAVSGNTVMNGMSNGNFSPRSTYTREQAYVTALRLFRCGQ